MNLYLVTFFLALVTSASSYASSLLIASPAKAEADIGNCEVALMGELSEVDYDDLKQFMNFFTMSRCGYSDYASRCAESSRQYAVWFNMSSGYSVRPQPPFDETDDSIFKMTEIPPPTTAASPTELDQYTLALLDRLETTWLILRLRQLSLQPPNWKTKVQNILGRGSKNSHLAQLPDPNENFRSFLIGKTRDDGALEIFDEGVVVNWLNLLRNVKTLATRDPRVLRFLSVRIHKLVSIRNRNWQAVKTKYSRYESPPALNLETANLKATAPASGKAMNSQVALLDQQLSTKTKTVVDISDLQNWLTNFKGIGEIPTAKISVAQAAMRPLREVNRLISDVVEKMPTPPKASFLDGFWSEERKNIQTIKRSKAQIRLAHDEAYKDLESLEEGLEAVHKASTELAENLDVFVDQLKALSTQEGLLPPTVIGLASLVEEANLMKTTALQTSSILQSRLERQLKWIETLMLLETMSSVHEGEIELPQEAPQLTNQSSSVEATTP